MSSWASPPNGEGWVTLDEAEEGFDWPGALRRLWKRRLGIGGFALLGALIGVGLSFVLPPVYEARVTLVEASGSGGVMASPLLSLVGDQLPFELGGRSTGVNTYPSVVRSRLLLTRVLSARYPTRGGAQVSLLDHLTRSGPEAPRLEIGARRLGKRIDAALDRRTGILTLTVRMDDPVLAAAVAKAVCVTLQDILIHTMNTQANASRRFIEDRLVEARTTLYQSEDALRAFRESNLRGSSPRLLTQEARLARESRTQEEIVLTLARQHEIARVEEQQKLPVVSVLDPPVPPAFRSAPRRSVLGALGLALGFACAAAWVLTRPQAA